MDRKLTTEVQVKGAEKAADQFSKVAAAEEHVAKGQEGTAASAEKAAEATDKLNASTDDLTGLLNAVHPALGGFAETLLRGSKVAGDLASRNISLAGAHKKAAAMAKQHAGALKLLGAGGAVVLGIAAIVAVVQALKAAHEEAEEAARKQTEALNEQMEQLKELERAYKAAANARMGADAVGADEAARGTERSTRVARRYDIDPALSATVGGELSGVDVDFQTQASYTMLREGGQAEPLDKSMPAGVRQTMVTGAVERNAEWIAADRKRRAEERQELVKRAFHELQTAEGGTTVAAEEYVSKVLGPEAEAKQIVEYLKDVGLDVTGARDVNHGLTTSGIGEVLRQWKGRSLLAKQDAPIPGTPLGSEWLGRR